MPALKRAYSYIRFSRLHQIEGDTLRRQYDSTRKYCEKKGLILDLSLSLEDKGVSAFRGKNAKEGALGRFIEACENGLVPKGSALIVESLDRLSRDKPRRTQRLLSELLDDHQIEIHLTMIDKILKPEVDDGFDAMYVVALATRANDESEHKSKRVLEAFAEKRQMAAKGEAVLINPHIPWWLEYDRKAQKFSAPGDRVKVVERIFKLAAEGWSSPQIARRLNEEHVPTWRLETRKRDSKGKINADFGKPIKWDSTYIRKLIAGEAAQGHLSPIGKVGRTSLVRDYYPRVISDELATEARSALARLARGAKGRLPRGVRPTNLFRNLLRFKEHWVRHGSVANRKPDATGQKSYNHHYECIDLQGTGKCLFFFPAKQLEPVLLSALSELQPDDLRPLESSQPPLRSQSLQAQVAKLEAKAENLLSAIESGSVSVAARLKEVENELATKRKELSAALVAETVPGVDAARGNLEHIRSLIHDLDDNEKRDEIAAALRRIISRIDVARQMRDLPMTANERGRFIRKLMENAPEGVADPSPTDRGRKPLYLFVSFIGGGCRLIVRDETFMPGLIVSLRVDPTIEGAAAKK